MPSLLPLEAPFVEDHGPGLLLRDGGPDQRHHAGPRAPVLDDPEHLAVRPVLVELGFVKFRGNAKGKSVPGFFWAFPSLPILSLSILHARLDNLN